MTNWKDALCDLRNAYRIVAAYQERVARTIQALSAEFPDYRYHAWAPVQFEWMPSLRGGTPPLERSPWDALPFQNYSVLFTPRAATRIRKGQCMIEISVEADNAFDAWDKVLYGRESYPDPAKLEPAGESESTLTIVAWVADRTFPVKDTWFDTIWKEHSWPDEVDLLQRVSGAGCSNFMIRWPLDEIFTAPDLAVFATKFKKALADKIDVRI